MYAVTHLLAILLAVTGPSLGDDHRYPRGVWPLQPAPTVVRGYDPPASDYGTGHRGVDLLGRPRQPVRSALPGVVEYVGRIAGRGVVSISHGGFRTTYEPVAPRLGIKAGRTVLGGSTIGYLQMGGNHCFPRACLHWGLKRGLNSYDNPLLLVGQVRLLPLRATPAGRWPSVVPDSRARVRLPVGLAQAIGGHVGVDLGRGQ